VIGSREIEESATILIRVDEPLGETATSLASRFARTAKIPPKEAKRFGYEAFDSTVVTDWNMGTFGMNTVTKVPVLSPQIQSADHVFPLGAYVVIPYQIVGYAAPTLIPQRAPFAGAELLSPAWTLQKRSRHRRDHLAEGAALDDYQWPGSAS
jgi:hypothetical protein